MELDSPWSVSSCDNLGYRAVISFWVVCLVMVSSISDSQPHYSVGLLYHRAGLAVQSFLLLYVEKYHIILLRLIALHSVCGCSHGCAFRFQHFHHLVGGGVGGVLLEIAGHGKNGAAHAYLGHAVWVMSDSGFQGEQ